MKSFKINTNRIIVIFIFAFIFAGCQTQPQLSLHDEFLNPPESAKPWVFWYWMRAAVTEKGISTDLEAMKKAGIGGAYLMPIKGADHPPLIDNPAVQLSPQWWKMVRHAFNEADRLGLKLAMHASDGFALAGGPWITPELSMQKVVWADTMIKGGGDVNLKLPQPQMLENYYHDIAAYAYPTPDEAQYSTKLFKPIATSSNGENVAYLVDANDTQKFRSDNPCWIQYAFEKPFLCRTVYIEAGNNFQAVRLKIEHSNDGLNFQSLGRLITPRHGWQDWDEGYTFAIKPTKAKYFRFVFDPTGTEPGDEDLDNAKWKANFKISTLQLSGQPRIGGIEGKNGSVWRIAEQCSANIIQNHECVHPASLINISDKIDTNGMLHWKAPAGNWTVLRVGHTSNGHTNYTAGGGLGLEVDKFSADAVNFQYEQWFSRIIDSMGTDLASRVLDIFHVDSWECGSQNWSPVFAAEFEKRRGYSLLPMLPVITGLPIGNIETAEKFLKDFRTTIVELTNENFYGVLNKRVHRDGCKFSAECIAPTMTSDGLLHYGQVDIPMGEFWFRSPTHDKPNDALDAISGAHIYGKPLVQVECFTELRMAWDEHPAMLKTLGDRNFAKGFNKFVFHVFTQNPWPEKKPGMTLDPIGLFMQANQTWWEPGKAWISYIQRCQTLLQKGKPVADVAVFTGEEIPRRSVLPNRLIDVLPGIIGSEKLEAEYNRLENQGQPQTEMPRYVNGCANISNPADWNDPLNGYAYDSFNPDVLLNLAKVKNGKVVLSGGAAYKLLVFPGKRKMDPNGNQMSGAVASKLAELVKAGATVLFAEMPVPMAGDIKAASSIKQLFEAAEVLNEEDVQKDFDVFCYGKGQIIIGTYTLSSFDEFGILPDFRAFDQNGIRLKNIPWNHRTLANAEIYFVSNQNNHEEKLVAKFRTEGYIPEIFDPLTGEMTEALNWKIENSCTVVPLKFDANGSLFVVFQKPTKETKRKNGENWIDKKVKQTLTENWLLQFDPEYGGPQESVLIDQLKSWTDFDEYGIKHYSGTVKYQQSFVWDNVNQGRVWLALNKVANIASVELNGVDCGVAWTAPYQVEISKALKEGVNELEIRVTNTWANRLIGDHSLPANEQVTYTTAPYMLEGKPLLEAGLLGNVNLLIENGK